MRSHLWLLCLASFLFALPVAASVPTLMNYQGYLTDATSNPKSGTFPMTFALFADSTGGSVLWTESYASVSVNAGVFNVLLGTASPLPSAAFTGSTLWLATTVSGVALAPRRPLVSVAYSFRSQRSDTASIALSGGSGSDPLWQTDGANVWRPSGRVGVGNTSPSELLHVENGAGTGASILVRSNVPGTGSFGKLQFQNVLATGAGIAAEIEAVRPVATWGQESDLLFKTNPGSSSPVLTERMRITKDGNVGIGLANPQTSVDMVGSLKMRLQSSGNNSGMSFNVAPESPSIGFHASDDSPRFTLATSFSGNSLNDVLRFSGNPVNDILVLKGNGNIGIGTSSPMDKLEVAGNVTIGAYDGTLNDVVLRAAGGCPNCGSNSEGGSNLVLRSGIGTGSAASGDIIFQVSDNANYGNQQPHAILEGMRIQTTTGNVSIPGSLSVGGTKCRVVMTAYGQLKMNAVESAHALFMDDEPTARLANGRCRVDLSPRFLATVTVNGKYPLAVNVTFYDRHGGDWYVERDGTGFTVVDPSGSNAEFSWQAIARQRGYEDTSLDPLIQTATK